MSDSTMARERPVVLVADDDEDILELVRFRLGRTCDVVVARDGKEALATARSILPDIAVLDVAMPLMDGFEVATALKSADATNRIFIILLTARVQSNDVATGFAAGADDYVTKPFSPSGLQARVNSALKGRNGSGGKPHVCALRMAGQ